MNKTTESSELHKLLTTFQAISLGEGDLNAGANLLTAMAVTLANIARPGSGIKPPETGQMRVGLSLLVNGSLTASLVQDDVITETALRQNNLLGQIRRLFRDKTADAKKEGPRAVEFPGGPKTNYSGNALYQLEHRDLLVPEDAVETWKDVFDLPPNPRIEDLAARPKVLVTAGSAKDLMKQLTGLHDNRPLVVLGLNSAGDASRLLEPCNALLDGLLPCDEWGETVLGNLLVTDPGNLLAEFAAKPSDATRWLGRLVWLVDGDTGPDANAGHAEHETRISGNMTGRFGSALSQGLAKRFNNHKANPIEYSCELDDAQPRWLKFLKDMEPRLPGIAGTARPLLATLAFGLIELANSNVPDSPRLRFSVTGIEALSRWIIRRMANARAAMNNSGGRQLRMGRYRKILNRLAERSQTSRDLYRALGLSADLCDDLLVGLESEGLVRRDGNRWESTGKTLVCSTEGTGLLLEL